MAGKVGLIGLGSMGLPMGLNLLKSGYEVTVWNRTKRRVTEACTAGAISADSPRELAERNDIVLTIVSDDQALRDIVWGREGLAHALTPTSIHVSMSTISPSLGEELALDHLEKGAAYVAAPVFGRPEAAAAAGLWICVSGAPSAKTRIASLLQCVGQGVFDFGENPAAAHLVKLAGNFLIASAIEAMSEAFALLAKNRVSPDLFSRMMSSSLFACPIYLNYGRIIVNREFSPAGFRAPLGLKDADLVLGAAASSHVPMPLAALVHAHLLAAIAKGRGDMDWTVSSLESWEAAGLT